MSTFYTVLSLALVTAITTPFAMPCFRKKVQKAYITIKGQVIKYAVEQYVGGGNRAKSSCTIEGGVAKIHYSYSGKDYDLRVPYNSRGARRQIKYRAIAKMPDSETLDITGQPGIPYFIKGADIGAEAIEIMNTLTQESKTLSPEEAIVYKK